MYIYIIYRFLIFREFQMKQNTKFGISLHNFGILKTISINNGKLLKLNI